MSNIKFCTTIAPIKLNQADFVEKNALPSMNGLMTQGVNKFIELESSVIEKNIAELYSQMIKVFETLPETSDKFEIDNFKFRIVVSGTGEIGILSALSRSITSESGIEITVRKKS